MDLAAATTPGEDAAPKAGVAARFERLGIDVWVRRGHGATITRARRRPLERPAKAAVGRQAPDAAPRPAPAPAKPAIRRQPPSKPPLQQPKPTTPAPKPPAVAPFRIHCHRCGEVFVCIGEDAWPHRRFILDVALAANRFVAHQRRDLPFDWPQPGAATDGHRRAFGAFFRHQMRHCARAILAGAEPARLLGHEPPTASGPLGPHFHLVPQVFDGEGKKRLWRQLRAWLDE